MPGYPSSRRQPLLAAPAPRVGVPAPPRHLLVPQITSGQPLCCILSQICRAPLGELAQPNLGKDPRSVPAKRSAASAGSSQQAADGAGKGEPREQSHLAPGSRSSGCWDARGEAEPALALKSSSQTPHFQIMGCQAA